MLKKQNCMQTDLQPFELWSQKVKTAISEMLKPFTVSLAAIMETMSLSNHVLVLVYNSNMRVFVMVVMRLVDFPPLLQRNQHL